MIYRKSSWTIASTTETRKKAEKRNQVPKNRWDKYEEMGQISN